MLTFSIAGTLMVAGALLFLLLPLIRRPSDVHPRQSSQTDLIALYRQQISEVQADVAAGLLPPKQLDDAKMELEHRLLSELPQRAAAHAQWHKASITAIALSLALPLSAGLLYWKLGNPGALEADARSPDFVHSGAHSTSPDQIETMVSRLADRLAANPDNPEGWAMLGRSYSVLGKHKEAASAFAKATALLPGDAALFADYADALAMTMNGKLSGKPMQLVRRALKLDPDNSKALALAGTEAFGRADYRSAVAFWERAVRTATQGTEFADSLRASLEEARALAGGEAANLPVERDSEAAPGMAGQVSGRVVLASALAANASPSDTVFVYAQAQGGPRMPLAILNAKVRDLPMDFVLDDSLSMSPSFKLSSVDRVFVTARISRAGSATPQPGDLQGKIGPVRVGTGKIRIEISEIVK
jgi:cytochrome c-type biogenesis protein CcmH